jgi:hypothetical protein
MAVWNVTHEDCMAVYAQYITDGHSAKAGVGLPIMHTYIDHFAFTYNYHLYVYIYTYITPLPFKKQN